MVDSGHVDWSTMAMSMKMIVWVCLHALRKGSFGPEAGLRDQKRSILDGYSYDSCAFQLFPLTDFTLMISKARIYCWKKFKF